jgi:DNA modification methylase
MIKRLSTRGQTILDVFAGSGTTLIAAEQLGRIARLVELDPHYCDVIIRRWQRLTGRKATREDGAAFDDLEPAA